MAIIPDDEFSLTKYVATLREQLEQLAEERTPDGLPRLLIRELRNWGKVNELN